MAQFKLGSITLDSIKKIEIHDGMVWIVLKWNKERVILQGKLKALLDETQLDPNEFWNIKSQCYKIESIQRKNDKIDEIYKNYHDASEIYSEAIAEAAVVYNEIMETINVRDTDHVHTKSFWISRLCEFVVEKTEFDALDKENAEEYQSILERSMVSLRSQVSELREHFEWDEELENFFTIN